MDGGCRCGRVRFRVSGAPLITMACHCTGCQKMSASAFSLSSLYASEAFEVTEGEGVIGGLHGQPRHFFCSYCMTWMFTRPEEGGFVNVRATLFDDTGGYAPFMETFTLEKLPWATTGATHSFERFPEPKDYPPMLKAFAEHAAGG